MKIHINPALILIEDRPAERLGERFGTLAKRKQPARDVLLTFESPAPVVIRRNACVRASYRDFCQSRQAARRSTGRSDAEL
jgi:hypothetical protein